MTKNIFIFDENKCVGCHACIVACMNENGFQSNEQWRTIHNSNNTHFPNLPLFYLSLACNHCDDAPCLKNCPAQAYSRDENTGAIIHHPEKCIGCKYCTWACPFDAPKYNPKEGIIEKCTFCNHRIEENLKPACANLCPTGALDFANTSFTREESIESSPVAVEVGSNIKVKKVRSQKSPEIDLNLFKNQNPEHNKSANKKITAAKEWPLMLFTLICSVLVSLTISDKTHDFSFAEKSAFIGTAIVAATLSMLHLGKKFRAWRSIINYKNSWLSKEIIFFSIFFAINFIDFYIYSVPIVIKALAGIIFLFSIDMLYYLATWKWPLKIHSAQTVLVGLSLFLFFTNMYYGFVFIASFRLTLYIYRQIKLSGRTIIITIRILSLLISALLFYFGKPILISISVFMLGEIIDRIQFYNELNVPDPSTEIQSK